MEKKYERKKIMNKIKIHFTAVFHAGGNVSIDKTPFARFNDNSYEDSDVAVHIVKDKKNTVVSFAAKGYFSDCATAAREFMVTLIQNIRTETTHDYTVVHDLLYPFVEALSSEIQYQSIHKISRNYVYANVGLEIESFNDGRLSDAIHILEDNDHHGINFKQCPNCRDFEIPDSKKLGQHIKRCPCCGLKLMPW